MFGFTAEYTVSPQITELKKGKLSISPKSAKMDFQCSHGPRDVLTGTGQAAEPDDWAGGGDGFGF